MAEEKDMEITFLPINTSKLHLHVEKLLQIPTECGQKTSDFPKGKKLPTYLSRAKEKRKNRDKRIGTGPAPLGGSSEGGKVSTHQAPSLVGLGVGWEGSFGAMEESAATGVRRAKRIDSRTEDRC